jgi:predicted lipoprotein with Yx(FWY)xxD motif
VTTHNPRRTAAIISAVTAALAVAACGSESASPGTTGGNADVATREVPGVGTVLVDKAGKTVYFTDSDSATDIRCVDDCLSLWPPVVAQSDNPDGGGVSGLSVVKRPDGTSQLAYQNKPLYTFTMDSTDKPASGHNSSDSFGGVQFTWHAVVLQGSAQPPKNDDGYGGGGGY